MKARECFILVASVLLAAPALSQSTQELPKGIMPGQPQSTPSSEIFRTSLNINNLWLRVHNDGRMGIDSIDVHGLSYPMYCGNLLYTDQLFWVGKVSDGQAPVIRSGGGMYANPLAVRPGAIISKGIAEDPQSAGVRAYRYRGDFQTADLRIDAAAQFRVDISSVTSDMILSVRQAYARDLVEWPWQKGAPFSDSNHNGVMDPGELPGIQGADQIVWFAYNDLDESATRAFSGDPPYGIEVQVTMWAYTGVPNLEDVAFKRYRLIYKGTAQTPATARIDSMYLTQWSDPDIGRASNDQGGCDSVLSLMYAFNGTYNGNDQDTVYQSTLNPTPGLGYALLQGPLVPSDGAIPAVFDFRSRPGFANLPMTACSIHMTGLGDGLSEIFGQHTMYYWNVVRGYRPWVDNSLISTTPWKDLQGNATKFMYYGDPETRTGWLAARPVKGLTVLPGDQDFSGDVRMYLSTGPFTMNLGDTQEIVLAMIASAAPKSAQNATWIRNRTLYIRAIYPNLGDYANSFVTGISGTGNLPLEFGLAQNFPNPFNPTTAISYQLSAISFVKLTISDVLGREVATLVDEVQPAGNYIVRWDASSMPSGVYFYSISNGEKKLTRKMMLLR